MAPFSTVVPHNVDALLYRIELRGLAAKRLRCKTSHGLDYGATQPAVKKLAKRTDFTIFYIYLTERSRNRNRPSNQETCPMLMKGSQVPSFSFIRLTNFSGELTSSGTFIYFLLRNVLLSMQDTISGPDYIKVGQQRYCFTRRATRFFWSTEMKGLPQVFNETPDEVVH